MKRVLIIFLLAFTLFSIQGFSQELYQYGVTAEIYENNTVHYKLNLIFANHLNQEFILSVGSPFNTKVNSDADCKVQLEILETKIVCNMKASDRTDVIIEYDSNRNVNKRDSYLVFEDSFRMVSNTNVTSILIKLPEGTGLRKPIENSYSPAGALIGSDGRRTIITWQKNSLKIGDVFSVSVAFERIGEIIETGFPIEILIIIIIAISSGVVLFYHFYWQNRGIKIILPILKKDEKMIFDTIIKHGNGVNQKIIVKDSGYSKAKVSKVLNSLKERGLLKLERIGRSNKVYIEKHFEKKK